MEQNQMFSDNRCSADCAQEAANGREYPSWATWETDKVRQDIRVVVSSSLDIVAEDDKKDVNGSGKCFETAAQMVNAEIQILKGIGDETNIKLWLESAELCKWWARQTSMPCLM